MYLFFDTETTGLPRSWKAPLTDVDNWPRLVQIAWILADEEGNSVKQQSYIVKPEGFVIPDAVARIHRINTQRALEEGSPISGVTQEFLDDLKLSNYLIAHNISFDLNVLAAEFIRLDLTLETLMAKQHICTKVESTDFCRLPRNKWPTLEELHRVLFNEPLKDSHNAMVDVDACYRCFLELKKLGIINLAILKSPV